MGADGAEARRHGHVVATASSHPSTWSTVGAGDAFCGALVVSLARGHDITDALTYACHAGAVASTDGAPDTCRARERHREQRLRREVGTLGRGYRRYAMSRPVGLLVVVAVVVALTACGDVDVPDAGDRAGFLAHLDARIPALMEESGVRAVAVALVDADRPSAARVYGTADEDGTAVTRGTTFRAASISKTITALAVLDLVGSGAVGLDDPIDDHLTGWQAGHCGVTVRRLLNHTAGLSVPTVAFSPVSTQVPSLQREVDAVRLVSEPGSATLYSGGGYAILQLLVEQLTDTPFARWTGREVLAPLGMSDSSFAALPTAQGFNEAGRPVGDYRYAATAAAGLVTSIDDLARLVDHLVEQEQTTRLMATPATSADDGVDDVTQGLGVFVDDRSGTRVIGHSGQDLGWASQWLAIPDADRGLAILTNSTAGRALAEQISCEWTAWTLGITPDDACP